MHWRKGRCAILRRTLLAVLVGCCTAAAAAAQYGKQVAELSAPPFVVHYSRGSERLAQAVADLAQRNTALPAIPRDAWTQTPIHIVLPRSEREFRALVPGAPEWGAGVAIPARGLVILPAFSSQQRSSSAGMGRVLRHELAHIALQRYLDPAPIPRWFNEGYSRWAAGEWDDDGAWMLRIAFALHRAPPLDSLDLEWPEREAEARVAYLLSMSTVAFLHERGGERALGIFLQRWKEMGALEPALRRTYGLSLGQFEEDWRNDVKKNYGWALTLSNAMVFWFFGSIAVLLLYRSRRRRNALKLEAMRDAEIPDDPAYWLEAEAEDQGGEEERPGSSAS